ncbi:type II secretion system protein [Desulfococcaceae bacterium HSG8]|nr:type II secretion system protein [Desulfococcaceae bacterium HSG8]
MCNTQRIYDEGFTLIETLVSIIILSVCLTVIFQLFSGGLRSVRLSKDYTRAIFYAREKMEEVLLAEKFEDGVWEGEFADGFKWKSEIIWIEPEEEEKRPVDMFNITVGISWNEGVREKHFEITTLKIAEKLKTEKEDVKRET